MSWSRGQNGAQTFDDETVRSVSKKRLKKKLGEKNETILTRMFFYLFCSQVMYLTKELENKGSFENRSVSNFVGPSYLMIELTTK